MGSELAPSLGALGSPALPPRPQACCGTIPHSLRAPVGCLSPRAGRAGRDCHPGSPPPSTGDCLDRVHSGPPPHPESSGCACQQVCSVSLEPRQAEATRTVLSRPALGDSAALLAPRLGRLSQGDLRLQTGCLERESSCSLQVSEQEAEGRPAGQGHPAPSSQAGGRGASGEAPGTACAMWVIP